MDFKTFATNIRIPADTSQIEYTVYVLDSGSKYEFDLVEELRRLRILCASVDRKLWVFGPQATIPKRMTVWAEAGLIILEQGVLDGNVLSPPTEATHAKDVFMEALEAGVTFALGRDQIYRVAPWTWQFPASTFDETTSPQCVTLRFQIAGPQRIVPKFAVVVKQSPLRLVNDLPNTTVREVLVAPNGALAKNVSKDEPSPDVKLVDGDSWRSRVVQNLQLQGIDIDPLSEEWIPLSLHKNSKLIKFTWPARLCFCYYFQQPQSELHLQGESDWRQWFDLEGTSKPMDPLAFTANWYSHSLTRGKQNHVLDSVMQDFYDAGAESENHVFTPDAGGNLLTSPPFHQIVAGPQGALDGIYPTPPDGMIQGPATQQTTSDNLGVAMQMDSSALGIDGAAGSDDSQARGRSLNSSAGPPEYRPIAEDLFGDMSEMDFGDNEVGDADFDYFDEPDETPVPSAQEETNLAGNELGEDMKDSIQSLDGEDAEMCIELDNVSEQKEHGEAPDDVQLVDHAHAQRDQTQRSGIVCDDAENTSARADTAHNDTQAVTETADLEIKNPPTDDEIAFAKAPGYVETGPLSPFGIRERLLPAPIPASLAQTDGQQTIQGRHGTLFGPLVFNEALNLQAKYNVHPFNDKSLRDSKTTGAPAEQETKRNPEAWSPTGASPGRSSVALPDDPYSSESDEDYSNSLTSNERNDHQPTSPWETWKMKQTLPNEGFQKPQLLEVQSQFEIVGEDDISEVLQTLHLSSASSSLLFEFSSELDKHQYSGEIEPAIPPAISSVQELFGLSNEDLVYTAQVISEQSIAGISAVHGALSAGEYPTAGIDSFAEALVRNAMENILQQYYPDISDCDISSLALIRETPRPNLGHSKNAPAGWNGHPRPNQRSDNKQLVPDYFILPSPYICIKRGADTWEMLPPALNFWSALSLGPVNDVKDVEVIGIAPFHGSVLCQFKRLIQELCDVYESRKLGTWSEIRPYDAITKLGAFEDGIMSLRINDNASLEDVLKAYASASVELGKALSTISHAQSERTFVVFIANPFADRRAAQYLCACFWMLCKVYREAVGKSHRQHLQSDVVLQLVPVAMFASQDSLVMIGEELLGNLATSIYERCPPSADATVPPQTSPLPLITAPVVELAMPPPKRIGFLLSSEGPVDLVHEGSVLHVAFALSNDGEWMSVTWVDTIGRFDISTPFCIRGRSFADVAAEVWNQTLKIIAAREVIWRIFIVAVNHDLEPSIQKCWRSVVCSKPRKQLLHVTLLSLDRDPDIQVLPPPSPAHVESGGQSLGAHTPVATPQSNAFTVSPDASGGQTNAPQTPIQVEASTTVPELGPDAHLIDIADESWGMLLAPGHTFSPQRYTADQSLASGMLFKRGRDPHGRLDSLGVALHWDIRIRPSGTVDDGPVRQAEITLREVLRMYRNLSVLAKAKGFTDADAHTDFDHGDRRRSNVLPLHTLEAIRAANGLNGFLK